MERDLSKAPVARDNKRRDASTSLRQAALLTSAQQIFQLHRTIGTRAVGRLLRAKLEVSHPGDVHEQEAERFADALTSMPTPGAPQVARQSADPVSAATEAPNGIHAHAEEAVSAASTSTGQPLPSNLRRKFEEGLGADLSAVRIHTGPASARASEAISARAYAVGPDIHFNHGQYRPETSEGQHLLAHEVVHTIQQGFGAASAQAKLDVSQPGDSPELEADRAADAVVKDQALLMSRSFTGSTIARKKETASPFAGAANAHAIEAPGSISGMASPQSVGVIQRAPAASLKKGTVPEVMLWVLTDILDNHTAREASGTGDFQVPFEKLYMAINGKDLTGKPIPGAIAGRFSMKP